MLISMTGYGEAVKKDVRCELRSLNHRFFRASISIPLFFSRYENKIESMLRERLQRGMVYCNIKTTLAPESISCDKELAKRYRDALVSLKESLNLHGQISVDQLCGFTGIIKMETDESEIKELWEVTSNVIVKATDSLMSMRKKEGKRIEKIAKERLRRVTRMLREIKKRIPERFERERRKIERIPFKEDAEGLYLLERINVEEEVGRLQFHLSGMKDILNESTSQGKRLLFLLQEILRETNTIANKIQDALISRTIVDMKTEIESMREEMENVL